MEVTEHNITNWELEEDEINELIRLVKLEVQKYPYERIQQDYYGIMIGKLMIMGQSKK